MLKQYVTMTEFLMNKITLAQLPPDLVANANTIVPKINELLDKFGEYRPCTSGYRTLADQMRINPKSPKSKHLTCSAIDISDADGRLNKFCKDHPELLEELGFYCEERQGNWQHFQCIKPASGHRWFFP